MVPLLWVETKTLLPLLHMKGIEKKTPYVWFWCDMHFWWITFSLWTYSLGWFKHRRTTVPSFTIQRVNCVFRSWQNNDKLRRGGAFEDHLAFPHMFRCCCVNQRSEWLMAISTRDSSWHVGLVKITLGKPESWTVAFLTAVNKF